MNFKRVLNKYENRENVSWWRNSTVNSIFGLGITREIAEPNVDNECGRFKATSRRLRVPAVCVCAVCQWIVCLGWMYIPVPGCRSELDSRTRATYRRTSVPCVVLGSRRVNGSNVGPFEIDKVVSWLSSWGPASRKKRFRDDRHPLIEVINSELHDQDLPTRIFQFQRNQRTLRNYYYFLLTKDCLL